MKRTREKYCKEVAIGQPAERIIYPKYRWFVMIVMFWVIFANEGAIGIGPAPLVGIISLSTGWELGTVTAIMIGSFTFFIATGCLLSAFLLDKIGIIKTFMLACMLSAAGAFLMPVLGRSIGGLVFLRLLEGLGGGLVLASPPKLACEWFPAAERGIVTGVQGAGVGFGVSIGIIISSAMYTAMNDWLMSMALMGIIPFIGLILSIVLRFGPEAPCVKNSFTSVHPAGINADTDFKLVLRQPLFYLGIGMIFFFAWVQQGYSNLTPGYLTVDPPSGCGLGTQAASTIFSFYSFSFTLGSLFSGFIGRYIFKNELKKSIALSFVLSAFFNVSVLLPAVYENSVKLRICLILAGFFFSWSGSMIFAYFTQCYPSEVMGRIGGFTQGIGGLGAPAGIAVGSITLNMTGSYFITLTAMGILCLLNLILTFFLYKPKIFAGRVG